MDQDGEKLWIMFVGNDILGERHLSRLLKGYLRYYHTDRCHLALEKDCPVRRRPTTQSDSKAKIITLSRVGGLYHRYEWHEAA
ncbi:hypothetical protein ACFL6M_06950 [Candidatus Eisenbacteria bacterium]|uniref:Integrase n=1 Tax=Eiseniibacteriota bacterium TaxID=2212470 RepID=A0ABV6YLW0_UNCEI